MSPMPGQAELEALVGMLDETDEEIYQTLKDALFSIGEEALPYLEKARLQKDGSLWQNRMDALISELQVEIACKKLSEWKKEASPNLLKGFYLLSSAFYSDLPWERVCGEFNRLHGDCWLLLGADVSLSRKLAMFNNFFFNQCGFRLGTKIVTDYNFADFFLPNLLNLRQGNDRSLALAYQYLAERNGLPVFLLNLPVVNLLACTTDPESVSKDDIRYCIDITHQGSLINRTAVEPVFSQQQQIQICNTVQALQDFAKLLNYIVSVRETNPLRKQAVRKLHDCLGSSSGNIPFSGLPLSDQNGLL
ncbi:MAG: transglutaminase-like domain-containing protein [Bacteroidales bacterium]|nr:transglutaminase-like domain-containing protein [Bacteroidales bacterium]